jgi:hypothetical protein
MRWQPHMLACEPRGPQVRTLFLIGGAGLLAACGAAEPPPPSAQAKLATGEWEVTSRVTGVEGPAAARATAKSGDSRTNRACIDADGVPPLALFAGPGESCEARLPYARSGKLNVTMSCKRKGSAAPILADVRGTFTADTITAENVAMTYVKGLSGFQVKQQLSGRRVGDCQAGAAAER